MWSTNAANRLPRILRHSEPRCGKRPARAVACLFEPGLRFPRRFGQFPPRQGGFCLVVRADFGVGAGKLESSPGRGPRGLRRAEMVAVLLRVAHTALVLLVRAG